MAIKKNYLTKERYEEIISELEGLKLEGRRTVAERLKHAKELGDLSENSEYQEARDEQARLEGKIAELEDLLRSSAIIEKTGNSSGGIRVGSRVTVKKGGEKRVFTIVGSNESKPTEGLISNESPIGQALIGKKDGDKVTIVTPNGLTVEYQILSIE
ncbi:transcription elongation factor GreA [Candidatus Parcubacteria bacterium]|jgi:transcription elongation factor GreA|nr:MAG: transcription elongation factor GreA [Candidatus Parcubacteria bacterium]